MKIIQKKLKIIDQIGQKPIYLGIFSMALINPTKTMGYEREKTWFLEGKTEKGPRKLLQDNKLKNRLTQTEKSGIL